MVGTQIPHHLQFLILELNFPKAVLIDFIHDNTEKGWNSIRMSVKDFYKELNFLNESTIYRALKELEEEGLLESDFSGKFDRTKVYKVSVKAIEHYYCAPNSYEEYYS